VSNASAIANRGEAILALNVNLGRALGDRLAQGLPRETIVERARREGLDLPGEVVDLFAWRDGSNPGHAMGALWLLPGYYLLSLDEALSNRAALREFRPDGWLPLLSDGGPCVLAVQCRGPGYGRVLHYDPEGDDAGAVMFPNLEAMLSAIEEALASAAFLVDDDGYLEQDDGRWLPIAARHSGAAPFWQRQLEALDAWVYLPAPGSTPAVEISAPNLVRQGVWIDLKARRLNGSWRRVRRRDVVRGQNPAPVEPPPTEEDVQANLRWTVEPDGIAEFNVPTSDDDPFRRRVRFRQPGVYTLRAYSAYPAPAESRTLTINVVPGDAGASSLGDDRPNRDPGTR
jgi:hypothetical protein